MKNRLIMLVLGILVVVIVVLIQLKDMNLDINPSKLIVMSLISMIPFFLIMVIFTYINRDKVKIGASKKKLKEYMKETQIPLDFLETYDRVYSEHIYELEQKRKKLRWRKIVQYIFEIIALVTYIIIRANINITSKEIVVFILFAFIIGLLGTIIMAIINIKPTKEYKGTYKENVIKAFVTLYNSKLEYIGNPDFNVQDMYNTPDFDRGETYNRFYADDYIKGEIDEGLYAKIVDLTVQYHSSGKNSYTKTLFEGLMVSVGINKNIKRPVKILHNELFYIFNNKTRVQLDSDTFEKKFDVFAENKIFATRLLTADIMEMLVDFLNKFDMFFEIVVLGEKLYLRFFTGKMFEPRIFRKSLDKEQLFQYYSILKFVVEVTQRINCVLEEIEE